MTVDGTWDEGRGDDSSGDREIPWVIAQLSGLARAKMSVRQIETAILHSLKQDPLHIYIPVAEDFYGKQDYGYGEYAFINFVPGSDYYTLESSDAFLRILKDPSTRSPQLIQTSQIHEMQSRIRTEVTIRVGDVVKIVRGNLRDNYGVVEQVHEDSVSLVVMLGQEFINSTVSLHDVRRSRKRTLSLQKGVDFDPRVSSPGRSIGPDFGEVPSVYILKEGVKKTRIMIGDRVMLVPNEEVRALLRWIEGQGRG